ncbi:hypothetical protein COLO4_30765 [Corchorus olitorius]|uniref:Protein FAR1-RELATED SEQUENCE n=1 Tax=Corchorus olitorius TaxID=93759 RepID=A0A1R3H703_9ROSI|nr:hypothetical protein COLO4_30765 [Corchorus olitorius]
MVEPPMDEEITLVDGIDQEYLCETNLEVSNENHDEHGNEENSGNNQEILEPYNGIGESRNEIPKNSSDHRARICLLKGRSPCEKYVNREDRTQVAPDETRTGCKAMIYVSKKVGVDRWIISRFTRDHNHELATPKSAPFLRAHRKRTRAQRNLIDVLDDSGVRPSKIMSVLATESGGIDKSQFAKCIHNVLLPSEFESEWAAIMGKYGLQENSWLKKLYSIREKWIPAYVRSSFCAGMSTTQRSESMNKYFKDYVNASTPMSKFVIQYDKALDARYNKEREQNFKTMNSKPILKTMYPMEKEASIVYTRKMFRKFQDELIHSQQYVAEKINAVEQVYKHQLAVLIKKKVHSIPNHHYFLDRWTRNAKKGEVDITSDHDNNAPTSSMMLFNSVMVHSLELSEKASRSQKHYDIAIGGLQRLFEELDALKIEDDKGNSPTDVVISKNVPEAVLRDEETHLLSQNSILLDPPHKGHTIRTCRLLKESRCGSSAEITSDPNATKQVSSSHIDQDSNTPQNLNQGQGRFNNQAGYANWNK